MSKYCVIGRHGLIGKALAERLGAVTSYPVKETKVVFHFGSYTHGEFEKNEAYFIKQAVDSFTTLLPYCYEHGILFVYPSSALVYEKDTPFARFKKTLEHLASCYPTRSLGLRIFPTYGPTEQRTVISQWCRLMMQGKAPVIYGDGKQARDFIFIDDVVDQILWLVRQPSWSTRLVDIGTGVLTSFSEIVDMINAELGTEIRPNYSARPATYSDGIICPDPLPAKASVQTGIRLILQCLKKEQSAPSSRRAAMLTSAL
jgi:nucleoside-diphosphate-sugar epimerase